MYLLSITFHVPYNLAESWGNFRKNILRTWIDLQEIPYHLTEIESEMVTEGKNTNLILFFENSESRELFFEKKIIKIESTVEGQFSDQVMLFVSKLNPIE